jgi:hypothetical protein
MTGLELSYMVSRLRNDPYWPGLQVIESSLLVLVVDMKLCAQNRLVLPILADWVSCQSIQIFRLLSFARN